MDTEPTQPETASSVASTDNVTQQTEGAVSTNGGKKKSWVLDVLCKAHRKR